MYSFYINKSLRSKSSDHSFLVTAAPQDSAHPCEVVLGAHPGASLTGPQPVDQRALPGLLTHTGVTNSHSGVT